MTVFNHLVPANTIGITPPLNPVQGAFIVQDVSRGIYAQVSASPLASTMVGYVPATSDGAGGITQLARALDAQYYSQNTTGFGASLTGTTLTVSFPSTPVLWNGTIQTLAAGNISGTVSTGLWSLVVGYLWGLTQVQLVLTSALSPTGAYIELCQINVNTTSVTATTTNGRVSNKFMQTLCVAVAASPSYGIPVSAANETMPW